MSGTNSAGYLNVRLQEKIIDANSLERVGGEGSNYNISLLKGERAILKIGDYYEEIVGIDNLVPGGYARTNQEIVDSINDGTANKMILDVVTDYLDSGSGKTKIEDITFNYIDGEGKTEIENIASDYINSDTNKTEIENIASEYITTGEGKTKIENIASEYINSDTNKTEIENITMNYLNDTESDGGTTLIGDITSNYINGNGKNEINTIASNYITAGEGKTKIENESKEFLQANGVFNDLIEKYTYPGIKSSTALNENNSRVLKFNGTLDELENGINKNGKNCKLHWFKSGITTSGASPYYGFTYPAMSIQSKYNEFGIQKYTINDYSKSYFTNTEETDLETAGIENPISIKDNALCFVENPENNTPDIDYVIKIKYLIKRPQVGDFTYYESWSLVEISNGTSIDHSEKVYINDDSILQITAGYRLEYTYNNDKKYTIYGTGNSLDDTCTEIDLKNFSNTFSDFYIIFSTKEVPSIEIYKVVPHDPTESTITTTNDAINFNGPYTKHRFSCQCRYFDSNKIDNGKVTVKMNAYTINSKAAGYFDNISEAKLSDNKKSINLICDNHWHSVYYHILPSDYTFIDKGELKDKDKYLYFVRFICYGEYGNIPNYPVYFKEFSIYPDMSSAMANTEASAKLLTTNYFESNITSLMEKISTLEGRIESLERQLAD